MPQTDESGTMDGRGRETGAERRERIEVLDAFMEECFCPTPQDLTRWEARHPRLSRKLRMAAGETVAIRVMTGVFRREDAPVPTREDDEGGMRIVSADPEKKAGRPERRGLGR